MQKPDLSHLPNTAGVYLHKNSAGEIIYVGKAVNLKSRVNQYWQKSSHQSSFKTAVLAEESVRVDYLETLSEIDALFLEAELIKRYQPKFNIELKDDKSATYVRIPYQDPIPAVSFTREPKDDGANYIGPFYSAAPIYAAMRILRRAIPYSTHKKIPKKPCLNFQIGTCPGPETENFDAKKYRSDLKKLEKILKGERKLVQSALQTKMQDAADRQDFEQAARFRNRLRALQRLSKLKLKEQEVLGIDDALAGLRELFGLGRDPRHIEGFDISHMSGKEVVASQVVFKNGVSSRTDYRNYKLKVQQNDDFASMAEVIGRRLSSKNIAKWGIPDLILIDGGRGQLAAAMNSAQAAMKDGSGITYIEGSANPLRLAAPPQGEDKSVPALSSSELKSNSILKYNNKLISLARENRRKLTKCETIVWAQIKANQIGFKFRKQVPVGEYIVDFMCKELGLVIEIDGAYHDYTATEDRERDAYLESQGLIILRIKNEDVNEFTGQYIQQYCQDIQKNKTSTDLSNKPEFPPLGEASVVKTEEGVTAQSTKQGAVPMFGLAKQFEEVIIAKDSDSIKLNFTYAAKTKRIIRDEGAFWIVNFQPKDPVRLLLERIRNEAHRFAVRYHTKLKSGSVKQTELTKIPGVGAQTARKLLQTFGSVNGVRQAPHNQLASVVGNIKAKSIERYFSNQ